MSKTRAEILADLAEMLRNFEDREYSGVIDDSTQFFGELGFASIDAILLGEKLEEFYGQKIAFNKFLSEAMQSGAEDIAVGDLVTFLERELQ